MVGDVFSTSLTPLYPDTYNSENQLADIISSQIIESSWLALSMIRLSSLAEANFTSVTFYQNWLAETVNYD
jgi:hypothetical protein